MGAGYILYVVVDDQGKPRRRKGKYASSKGTLMVYEEIGTAKSQCRVGDAVMRLPLDLGQEPVHIRERKEPEHAGT